MTRCIRGYEGIYEINEHGTVRRMDGRGSDGRKISAHVVLPARTKNNLKYVILWKDGKRRTFMLHKIYANTFEISENEAARRLYRGFKGSQKAKDNIIDLLNGTLRSFGEAQRRGEDRHDEILYLKCFLRDMMEDRVQGIQS